MPIRFSCSDCGKQLQTPDEFSGRRIRCKDCGAVMTVPAADEPAPEQEEAERPRPRKRRRSRDRGGKSRGSGLKIGIILGSIAALLLCVLCAGGGGIYYAFFHKPSLGSEMKYLPDNYSQLTVIEFDKVKSSAAYPELQKCPNFKQRFGFAFTAGGKQLDVTKAMVAQTTIDQKGIESVTILTMKSTVTIQDLIDPGAKPTESRVGDYVLYEVGGHTYFVDGKHAIFGSPTLVRAIAGRKSDPAVTENMRKALKEADFSKPEVMIIDPAGLAGGLFRDVMSKAMGDVPLAIVADAEFSLPMKRRAVFICKDAAAASSISQKLKSMPMLPQAKVSDMNVRVSGSKVIIEGSVPANQICDQ